MIMRLQSTDEMAYNVDTGQTAPYEQFDQGLNCLPRLCPNVCGNYGISRRFTQPSLSSLKSN